MIGLLAFMAAVAILAVLLGVVAVRAGRWLEAGISIGCLATVAFLAVAVTGPVVTAGVLVSGVSVTVVLVGLAAWSYIRAVAAR